MNIKHIADSTHILKDMTNASKVIPIQTRKMRTMVVDITYMCNATCRYCQWGSNKTPGRNHLDLKDLLIPAQTLKNLHTERVVLSGGEPRIHPQIELILNYYSKLAKTIIITNGMGLDTEEVKRLLKAGATGFSISLDSVDAVESFVTRSTLPHIHQDILKNLENLSKISGDFEYGINAVVSSVTANWTTVNQLLEFGNKIKAKYVKFQPIFDDGYASKNASDLLLDKENIPSLLKIASRIDTIKHPITNSSGFWRDVAAMVQGIHLLGRRCGLDSSQSISVNGNLSMCYWVKSSSYGKSSHPMREKDLIGTQTRFEKEKPKCSVDFHCFCNQEINHKWMDEK